jgi:hypothetical protein
VKRFGTYDVGYGVAVIMFDQRDAPKVVKPITGQSKCKPRPNLFSVEKEKREGERK